MDPVWAILTNDSVFMLGPWDHSILLHASEDRTAFNFSLVFKLLPICTGHHNICAPIKGQIIWAYILQEIRTTTHMDLFSSYSLDFSDQHNNITNSNEHSFGSLFLVAQYCTTKLNDN